MRQLAEIFLEAQGQDVEEPNETAQQSLAMLEQLAKGQGSGEITIFFNRVCDIAGEAELIF